MARCDVCGNDYDKAFTVTLGSDTKTFDSFECAIHALAPAAIIAGVKSSVTDWSRATSFSVAPLRASCRSDAAPRSCMRLLPRPGWWIPQCNSSLTRKRR